MKLKALYSASLILLICSLTWLSCKKDIKDENNNNPPANANPIPAATPVTGSVSGLVVDETNIPVSGAEVKIGTSTFTTGANGVFTFNNVTLDKYVSTVTINKTGYFKALRSFSANATRNYVSVKLIPKTLAGSVNSSNPTPVSLSNGTKISFQSNSIVDKATGAAYSGNVNVFAAYIDPTTDDISSVVPGSFMGKDATNIYALSSTGMIAVDLESPSGQALQLATNQPATIKLPIPASLLSKAPATIDTWSLDDQGVWKKEGTATKNGDAYDMQVTHFSFWNCDVPANSTYLTIHVQDQNGNSFPNTLVSLTIPNNNTWWATTYGYTDSLGNVSGIIPAGVELEMNVYANPYNCSTPLYTQNVGPFTSSSTITVTITTAPAQVLTVSGTAEDCGGGPLQDGTAIISAGQYGYYYTSVVNGSYSINITHCGTLADLNVTILDNGSGSQGSSGSITVSGNSVTVPVISVCGGTQSAVFTFGNPNVSCQVGAITGTYTQGTALTNNIVSVMVDVIQPGTYTITSTTVNGISFSGSGIFTTLGQQFVELTGSGTPVNTGTYTYQTQTQGITGCYFYIPVSGPQLPQAVLDFSGTCSNIQVNGTYTEGIPLLQTANTVMITVNVTSPGTYNIYTNTVNGMIFSDSGTVTTTGTVNILLSGYGSPGVAGNDIFTLLTSNGTPGCTFAIQTQPGSGIADYTFGGAPGNCSGASPFGTYSAGVPLNGQNTVPIVVNVTTPGSYIITTNSTNGMSFNASGVFTTTGVQTILLTGGGIPINIGSSTFIVSSGGITGCLFIVIVN